MPGGIDTHVHLAHPIDRLGIKTADDFHTGTVAAACGGVTTIIDFALQRRGDSLVQARDDRLREVDAEAVIDYGLHVIVTDVRDDVLAEIPALIGEGFPSFKVYMTYTDKVVPDDALIRVLEATAQHAGLVYLHCENDCAVTHLIQRHLGRGDTGPLFHARSRPSSVEAEATYRAIMLAEVTGAPICVAHVTSAEAATHVGAARERDQPVVCETCPQYLTLTEEVYDPSQGFEAAKYVCSPPIRSQRHRDALWGALTSGVIQQVASDHAPFRFADQKTQGQDDFTRIPNGLPGIETRLPLLFTEGVRTGRMTASRFVELVSTNPARIFGMYPQKGSCEIGADADLIVIDPANEIELNPARLHSAVDYDPYEGMRVSGFPTWTISRGEIIAEQGEPRAARGRGQLVERTPVDPGRLP
jgi:dihydropyrimidinase